MFVSIAEFLERKPSRGVQVARRPPAPPPRLSRPSPSTDLPVRPADIEYRELQKAFTLLNKRLKPLEHFQPTPTEFKDLCYLLSAKSVHDAPSFKNWEGVNASRQKLVEQFGRMVEGELEEKEGECGLEGWVRQGDGLC